MLYVAKDTIIDFNGIGCTNKVALFSDIIANVFYCI